MRLGVWVGLFRGRLGRPVVVPRGLRPLFWPRLLRRSPSTPARILPRLRHSSGLHSRHYIPKFCFRRLVVIVHFRSYPSRRLALSLPLP